MRILDRWRLFQKRLVCPRFDIYLFIPLGVSTCCCFPHSWITTGFVTRVTPRASLVQQELFTLPGHMSSPWILSGVRLVRSVVFCVMRYRSLFVLFCLPLALFVFIRFMDCEPLYIFKLLTVLIDSSFVVQIKKRHHTFLDMDSYDGLVSDRRY